MKESYDDGVTDEFMKPIVVTGKDGEAVGKIKEGDVVVFFNFRNDRAKGTYNCSYPEGYA